ncbi:MULTISPECIES: polyprenol monophosphomannose synthase [Auritidibacter]|uniref:polyprenol monophosphomannose synthase n=1 Tax=Auritidibacter TaxID=1160973 RepID=UPI000D72858E|nr:MULTISPECIES: polyprenol monophosphomannose synthase [Auritidibacter]AXR73552.1 polyprenol monophosphomannose synthase [Auritidibacter sp. NML130574]NIH70620.1 dolichol-phosphate mannosyltransferase [Auritidibacter ignavus]PXA77817.1 dolichol-phosphate mannosyltransferase [Auritidibacter sp. NML100628]PXA81519.1 dolichol-phosphate mannosyltransferase [Auritidibacter sp. NML120636]RMX22552.1 polyprenol monophosphomannose synthase [Auritidibacter ignavus]
MKVLTIIPTYNEAESLPGTLQRVRVANPEVDVLVVDDNSPDGTGEWADEQATQDSQLHVLHRTEKNGLGGAYLAGFAWGLERGYDVLVEMDADGSHQPEQLHRLLDAVNQADLVIGSRRVPGGKMVNWPWYRKLISMGGSVYPRILLGLKLTDITAGYRAYRADTLRELDLDAVQSKGYGFQVDMTFRTALAGKRIVEVPITFVEREFGESKMSGNIITEALVNVTKWGVQARWETAKKKLGLN